MRGRAVLGVVLGWIVRLWVSTLRVELRVHPALATAGAQPWVLAFWHGRQWPLLAWRRRRPTVVLVSWSSDGALQARALAVQGFDVVRGSSTRGGARGLAALIRRMRIDGGDAAFAVDGPRGPIGVVKPGVVAAAKAARAVVVPMAGRVRRGFVLRGAWDQFAVAWPFTTVDVALGAPIDPARPDARVIVERSLVTLQSALDAGGRGETQDLGATAIASISTEAPRGSAAT